MSVSIHTGLREHNIIIMCMFAFPEKLPSEVNGSGGTAMFARQSTHTYDEKSRNICINEKQRRKRNRIFTCERNEHGG